MPDASVYTVAACRMPVDTGAPWDSPAWRGVSALTVEHAMGEPPAHRPLARVKLQYDAQFVHLVFLVEDRWVRSLVTEYQGDVWTDSCVEFFFTPGTNLDDGYFNLEVNCGGAALFTHRLDRSTRVAPVGPSDARQLRIAHTLPARVDPELAGPVSWEVSYRIPWKMLEAYAPVTPPGPGVTWRANFYKCADAGSHPHWLTWAPVRWAQPDFHRKEFFGTLAFADRFSP
jgi:hypothetical protein